MAVPNLPFNFSDANLEFLKKKAANASATGLKAKLSGGFWASELAGKSLSLPISNAAFSRKVYVAGHRYSGGGKSGQPGKVLNYSLDFIPFLKGYTSNVHGSEYTSPRDMAFFGEGVEEDDLIRAGIDPDEAIGTSRNLRFIINARVDHDYDFGFYQFNRNKPWNGSFGWLTRGTFPDKGRQTLNFDLKYWSAPPKNTIWVPYLKCSANRGEHAITVTVETY